MKQFSKTDVLQCSEYVCLQYRQWRF